MHDIEMRTFTSLWDFAATLAGVFRGPTFLGTFRRMEGRFREGVILAHSITNNCGLCTRAHSAWGMSLGLTRADIDRLVALKKIDFTEREWLAFNYARKFAILRGREPRGPEIFAFSKAYSRKERADIKKILRMMKLANYTATLILGEPFRAELSPGRDFSRSGLLGRFAPALKEAAVRALELRERDAPPAAVIPLSYRRNKRSASSRDLSAAAT